MNTNREGWTKREEFIENVLRRNEEEKGTARTDAAALEDVVAMEENGENIVVSQPVADAAQP